MKNRLDKKIALVTGGARGIGKAITQLFVEHGAQVIVVDLLDRLDCNINHNDICDYLRLDVSKQSNWEEVYNYVESKYRTIDILVNNAAITGVDTLQDPEHMNIETWEYIHSVNLTSVFLGCKFAINIMKSNQRQSSVINIASRSGVIATPNLAAYSSAKAAIRNYSKAVAIYCIQQGYSIRCNTISPSVIDTDMWNHYRKDNDIFKAFIASLPLKRMGTAEEVANAALYLGSDESSYTTGSEIIVDGGILSICGNPPK
jgi:NAD(P)-dependent dehydrogenase (short-subunit alcohol dehydrogenase family)